MRVENYDFVFDDWPARRGWVAWGWRRIYHTGWPYVQFHVVCVGYAVVVRCDPCSADQDRTAYAQMVRTDLEIALVKASKVSC